MAVRNNGLRKICGCRRANWPRCAHAWHFNFKPRGGPPYRFSLDAEVGRHIDSKTEAENEATNIRSAILAGAFERSADRRAREHREAEEAARRPIAGSAVTFKAYVSIYVERASKASGKTTWEADRLLLGKVGDHVAADGRRLRDWPLAAVTEDELEAFHASLIAAGRAASTRNHYVHLIKAAFRWAARKGYIARSPISDDSALVRSKHAQRARRITPEEEAALPDAASALTHGASARLYGLIVAALETGCRLGELLAWQWSDVDLDRREIRIRGENTKDEETRRLPISSRLAAVLAMAQTGATGEKYGGRAYVFGVLGERVKRTKKAWETCVLRAHGHEPRWVEQEHGKLCAESRAALRAIDLRFHDLRHEAGSRWLEGGWPIHHVKEMLGHANISQTDTYLNVSRMGLHESMKRFDDVRCKTVASEPPIEHKLPRNDRQHEAWKDLLH
jgi:integrase